MDTPPPSDGGFGPGTRIGPYEVIELIARGGMGELHLAATPLGEADTSRLVAVKRLLPSLAGDPELVKLFEREARVAGMLSHPNVVRLEDCLHHGGEHVLVFEFVHGKTLREIAAHAKPKGGVPQDFALAVVVAAAAGLHHAHRVCNADGTPLGLVHRDVSPENVLVSHEGWVKLADFGVARAAALTRLTNAGELKGKVGYMAPEQIRGDPLDARADVFALGVVLYELATGRRLFDADNPLAAMNRVMEGSTPRPSEICADVDLDLEAIMLKALQAEPEDRQESAEALQFELEEYARQAGKSLSAGVLARAMARWFGRPPPPTATATPTGARRRRADAASDPPRGVPVRWAVAFAGLAAGLAVSAAVAMRPSVPAPEPVIDRPNLGEDAEPTAVSRDPAPIPKPSHKSQAPPPQRPDAGAPPTPAAEAPVVEAPPRTQPATNNKKRRDARRAKASAKQGDPDRLFPFGRGEG